MALLGAAVVSGVAIGLLYGLLAFSIVVLFKATGVANFAQGNIATFLTFIVFFLVTKSHLNVFIAIGVGFPIAFVLGLGLYFAALRFRDGAGTLNLTIRTMALYLLLFAVMTEYWGSGEPYAFPRFLPQQTTSIFGARVAYGTFAILLASLGLAGAFAWFFRRTRLGLLFLGLAEKPDVARLLGVDVRLMTALAWGLAASVSLIVGIFAARTALLFSGMMELFLLYSFTAAILGGGLTSLPGTYLGGAVVGIIVNVVSVFGGSDLSVTAVFVLLILVLLVRPNGLIGQEVGERV